MAPVEAPVDVRVREALGLAAYLHRAAKDDGQISRRSANNSWLFFKFKTCQLEAVKLMSSLIGTHHILFRHSDRDNRFLCRTQSLSARIGLHWRTGTRAICIFHTVWTRLKDEYSFNN